MARPPAHERRRRGHRGEAERHALPADAGRECASGDLIEVDKGKQLLFLDPWRPDPWVLNTSTGGDYTYTYTDRRRARRARDTAITHNGNHRVYRFSDEARYESTLGILYRPRFIVGGVAVHGYSSVPNYPASHGCIRVSNPAMDMIWGENFMPMGQRAWVHD